MNRMRSLECLGGIVLLTHTVFGTPTWGQWNPYKNVIALSVDGLHGSDVDKYVALKPKSAIAGLLNSGVEYQNCYTSAVCLYRKQN